MARMRGVKFGVFLALLLATGISDALLGQAASEQAQATAASVEKPVVYQPKVDKSMYDPKAQENSPLRGFWDDQTKQKMDANISNELDRRRAEGWTGEGGNVVKAMGGIREGAKEGSHVDAEQLKREASEARAKLRGVVRRETPSKSLEDKEKQETAKDEEQGRGQVVMKGKRGREFLNALNAKQQHEAAEKMERERKRVEGLRSEGNFMRRHPSREATAAAPAA